MSTQKNLLFYKPKPTDGLNYLRDDIEMGLNCHAIGTIQSFNYKLQTATATINYQKVLYQETSPGLFGQVLYSYPVLVDCPIRYDIGAAGGDTHPYQVGDEVFIGFNDRDMDNWFAGYLNQAPFSARVHSFADAVILGNVKSTPNVILNFDPQRSVKRAGTAVVGVNPTNSKVLVTNTAPTVDGATGNLSYSSTLNTLLQQLLTEIQNITVGPGTFSNGGGPVIGVSGTPLNASTIASTATAIGVLLE